ncbi:alpha/beta fold hydrolase [Alteromonas flava]|uniref:alpha/beta fold hydrolase n=1 Tax=Alteromonas flava TaxID=2048003 RepID=UPI000C289C54|nr:alpha/beta hydrolase [Alteromonas flava]
MAGSVDAESRYIEVSGLRLHYLLQAPAQQADDADVPIIVFLHGFPEHCGVWRRQLAFFGQRYQAIALDLPGYNLSEGPSNAHDYNVPNLVNLIARFIRSIANNQPIYLVAHDWGGAIAWPLTARFPELIKRLVIINAAHPSTFTREMIQNRQQRLMSDYIHTFLDPKAEEYLSQDGFKQLKQHSIEQIQSPPSEDEVAAYVAAWKRPGAVTRMLNYYRAMPQLFPREGIESQQLDKNNTVRSLAEIRVPNIKIRVPTLILWGEKDAAFDIGVLGGLGEYIDDYEELRFPAASHWVHHEEPEAIQQAIDKFIYTA